MSFSDQETARLRKAFASLARTAVAEPDCPEPERIWRAAAGELPAEVQDLVGHIAGCPTCAEEWRLARELIPDAQPSVASLPASLPRYRSRRWLAAAAALVFTLVGVQLWRASIPTKPPDTVRAAGDPVPVESLLGEDVVLSRSDCSLRWTSGGDWVLTYDLLVATESFDVLVRAEGLAETAYRVPREALDQVPPGGKILWQVEAIGPSGHEVVSPTFVHRLE